MCLIPDNWLSVKPHLKGQSILQASFRTCASFCAHGAHVRDGGRVGEPAPGAAASASGIQFTWPKNRLKNRLRIRPRLNFDSLTCLNYLFLEFFQYRKSQVDSQAVFQAVFWPCELNPRGIGPVIIRVFFGVQFYNRFYDDGCQHCEMSRKRLRDFCLRDDDVGSNNIDRQFCLVRNNRLSSESKSFARYQGFNSHGQ